MRAGTSFASDGVVGKSATPPRSQPGGVPIGVTLAFGVAGSRGGWIVILTAHKVLCGASDDATGVTLPGPPLCMFSERRSRGRRPREWAVDEDPGQRAVDVAARILRMRLEAVWAELQAACGSRHDPERVHQLRVATRRTIAAIAAFDTLIPRKARQWFEKRLRRMRRAAGNARDLDVLTDRLARDQGAGGAGVGAQRARRRLVAMLSRQRAASRRPIHEVREDLLASDWPGRVERLLDSISARGGDCTFRRYALRQFEPLLERFRVGADRKLRDADDIHRLRIEAKKLRYTLEIFATVFPERTRDKCEKAVTRLQERLGEFTDHAAAADRLRRWARQEGTAGEREAITALLKVENELADEARHTFTKWWNPTRRRALRRRFDRTLRRGSA